MRDTEYIESRCFHTSVVPVVPHFCTMAIPPKDDNASIHRERVVSEWFDEHKNDVNHMPWLCQSPDINPTEHFWEIQER